MLVMIDNYDSFTYNLVQMIESLSGQKMRILRNDSFDPDSLVAERPKAIVISPGPGIPSRAGRIVELIQRSGSIPLLGICLGHQAIGEAFGARVVRGAVPVHGKVTNVVHAGDGLFAGCDNPMAAARYHSLIVERGTVPPELRIDASTADHQIMALTHRTRPVFGIQFHPESFGTTGGARIVQNFLGRIA